MPKDKSKDRKKPQTEGIANGNVRSTLTGCGLDSRIPGARTPAPMEGPMKRLLPLAFIVLAAVTSAQAQFTFTSIDFPGGTLTTARGINNHSEIVGAYRIVPPRHALLIKDGQ